MLLAAAFVFGGLWWRSAEDAQGFVAGALSGQGRSESVVARRGSRTSPKNGKVYPQEARPVLRAMEAATDAEIHQMMADARREKLIIRMQKFRRLEYDLKRHPMACYKIKMGTVELKKRQHAKWAEEENARVAERQAKGLPIFEEPLTAVEADEQYGRWTKEDQIRAWSAASIPGEGYYWQPEIGFYTRVHKAKSKWGPRTQSKDKMPHWVEKNPRYTDHEHTFHWEAAKKFAEDNGLEMPHVVSPKGSVPFQNLIKYKTFLEDQDKPKVDKIEVWLRTGVPPNEQPDQAVEEAVAQGA